MLAIRDGLFSLFAALAATFLCGVPAVLAALALTGRAVPGWLVVPGWIAVAGLAVVGLILTVAFARKARGGIAPARDRRR